MKAPIGIRIAVLVFVCVPAALLAWAYVATHQLGRTWEELRDEHHVTWPPHRSQTRRPVHRTVRTRSSSVR